MSFSQILIQQKKMLLGLIMSQGILVSYLIVIYVLDNMS